MTDERQFLMLGVALAIGLERGWHGLQGEEGRARALARRRLAAQSKGLRRVRARFQTQLPARTQGLEAGVPGSL